MNLDRFQPLDPDDDEEPLECPICGGNTWEWEDDSDPDGRAVRALPCEDCYKCDYCREWTKKEDQVVLDGDTICQQCHAEAMAERKELQEDWRQDR